MSFKEILWLGKWRTQGRVAKAKSPWAVSDLSEAAYPCFNLDQHFLTKFMDDAALSGGQAY